MRRSRFLEYSLQCPRGAEHLAIQHYHTLQRCNHVDHIPAFMRLLPALLPQQYFLALHCLSSIAGLRCSHKYYELQA